jgi:hypothetical protein
VHSSAITIYPAKTQNGFISDTAQATAIGRKLSFANIYIFSMGDQFLSFAVDECMSASSALTDGHRDIFNAWIKPSREAASA